jgi:hypothetical protein
MTQLDATRIAETLPKWALEFVDAASPALGEVPEEWQPIARSGDAEERRLRAMALWNRDFLDLVPEFARTATTRLADVRACVAFETPLLVYVFDDGAGGWLSRVGWAPRDPTEPRLWSSVPAPLRTFLREVHAGFVGADGESFGPLPPRAMQTLAEIAESPDGDPDWDEDAAEDGRILSARLMQIARNAGLIMYCVSPDLPPGQLALVYEGDVDPVDFGPALDELLLSGITAQ